MSLTQEQISKIDGIVNTGASVSQATAEEKAAARDWLIAQADAKVQDPAVASAAMASPVLGATVARNDQGNVVVCTIAIRKTTGLRMMFSDTFYGV